MKIIIRPVVDPRREIDLTHRLVSAVAHELWELFGGNEQLNWLEAERHLERLIGEARDEAAQSRCMSVARAARAGGPGQFEDGKGGVKEQRCRRVAAGGSRRLAGGEARRGSTNAGVNAGHGLSAAVSC